MSQQQFTLLKAEAIQQIADDLSQETAASAAASANSATSAAASASAAAIAKTDAETAQASALASAADAEASVGGFVGGIGALAAIIGQLADQINGGQIALKGGTLADPALSIGTVGVYSSATDTLSIAIAGSEVARFTASGLTVYGTVTEV
jgi:hypothetical protein